MDKKILIPLVVVILLLVGGVTYLSLGLFRQVQANKDMKELAEMDKKEMENEYEMFARQYSEMKTQINNDSIIAQLTQEQLRTQQLLEELREVKSTDAREIARLKKELATVRAVLRSYVIEIDSLNRLNQKLMDENARVKDQYQNAERQIQGLSSEKATLSQKVAIAAQLDATNIAMVAKKKNGKAAKRMKDCTSIEVSFVIAKNVTASNGVHTLYARITSPAGGVLGGGGTFAYEDRDIEYTMRKDIEYTGEETAVSMYWQVTDFLSAGTYNVSIFSDGNMIGSRSFTFNK